MSLATHPTKRDQRRTSVPRIHPNYRRRMRLADGLQIVAVVSVAMVISIFLADGGAARFGTAADAITSLGGSGPTTRRRSGDELRREVLRPCEGVSGR